LQPSSSVVDNAAVGAHPRVVGLTLLLAVIAPAAAHAQRAGLALPTIAVAGAATADWVSTYYALTHADVHESNPVLHPIEHRPKAMVALGGAIDVGAIWAWNARLGRPQRAVAVATPAAHSLDAGVCRS